MQQLLLANPKSLHKRVMFHVSIYWFFVFCFCFCYLVALAIVLRSLHALLFLKSCLVFLASHLATLMPCTLLLSCFAPCCFHASLHFIVMPYFYHITPCYFRALLHLFVMPCYFCIVPYCCYFHTLLLSFSRLAICATLRFTPCYHAIAPCCSTLLVARPCCPTIVLCYSPFSSTSCPPTPLLFCCMCSLSHLVALPCLLVFHLHFLV